MKEKIEIGINKTNNLIQVRKIDSVTGQIINTKDYNTNDPELKTILEQTVGAKKTIDENCQIVEEHQAENKKSLKSLAKTAFLTGGLLLALSTTGCATAEKTFTSVAVEQTLDEEKEETKDMPENTNDVSKNEQEEIKPMTVEELKSDSRYTEITEENLTSATQEFMMDFSSKGIDLDGADALTFTSLANITHMDQTNPDLSKEVFGSYPEKEVVMSKAGHIIGQIATLEMVKGEEVDWTVVFIDETDRKIALHAKETLKLCREIAKNSELSEEDKTKQIQSLIQERFVKPNYDKSVGYEYNGEKISKSQEDGADFITDAIFTGIIMGDNTLKNYVYGSETMDDMLAIAANEDVVSNIHTIIENCQTKSITH